MKVSTFEEDFFGLKAFAEQLEKFIASEIDFVDDGLVIALSSRYGSGKTTFFSMWKDSLDNENENADNPRVVSLNAWESDYYGDPLFAIVSGLVEAFQGQRETVASLVEAAKNLGWFMTAIGSQVADKFSGIDPVAAGAIAERKAEGRNSRNIILPDSFSLFQQRKEAMAALKKVIASVIAASEPRVIFLVDELDRCRPDYAISYLETIKHIFDIKGAVFILAADRKQLENSAKAAFGQDLDFEEYYRKFIHREITLPCVYEPGYKKLVQMYVTHYFENTDAGRYCFMALDYQRIDNISELMHSLNLTPRQAKEVFRVLGHMFSTSERDRGQLRWCLAVGSIAMSVLRIGAPKVYQSLGAQSVEPHEAFNFFNGLFPENPGLAEWWLIVMLTGGAIRKEQDQSDHDVLVSLGLGLEIEGVMKTADLGKFRNSWSNSGIGRIQDIHTMIEQAAQWS